MAGRLAGVAGGEATIKKRLTINWQIRAPKVKLIDENGQLVGIFERDRAIFYAKDRGFDLALVGPNAFPPIARLIDYGKYQYDQEKQIKKQKKKKETLKEIRFGGKISDNDLEIKSNKAKKFLEKGDRVRINVRLRGREMQFQNRAYELLNKVTESLSQVGELEIKPHREGNQFISQFIPKINQQE